MRILIISLAIVLLTNCGDQVRLDVDGSRTVLLDKDHKVLYIGLDQSYPEKQWLLKVNENGELIKKIHLDSGYRIVRFLRNKATMYVSINHKNFKRCKILALDTSLDYMRCIVERNNDIISLFFDEKHQLFYTYIKNDKISVLATLIDNNTVEETILFPTAFIHKLKKHKKEYFSFHQKEIGYLYLKLMSTALRAHHT